MQYLLSVPIQKAYIWTNTNTHCSWREQSSPLHMNSSGKLWKDASMGSHVQSHKLVQVSGICCHLRASSTSAVFCELYYAVLYREQYRSAVPSPCSRVWLFATLWTSACQAPLPMRFSRQESWRRLSCSPPGIWQPKSRTHVSFVSSLAGRFFPTSATGEAPGGESYSIFISSPGCLEAKSNAYVAGTPVLFKLLYCKIKNVNFLCLFFMFVFYVLFVQYF